MKDNNIIIKYQYNIEDLLERCQFELNDKDTQWMKEQIDLFLSTIPPISKYVNQQSNSYVKFWQVTKLRPDVVDEHIDNTILFQNGNINLHNNCFEVSGQLYGGE